MTRWMTLAVLLVALGGIASPTFADDMDAPRPKVPARGTEGPDISAKPDRGILLVRLRSLPSTYPPAGRGVEGPEER